MTKSKDRRIEVLEQQVQECIKKLEPLLVEISGYEHQIDQLTALSDEVEFHQRAETIGHTIILINDLCGPRLALVFELVFRIWNMGEHKTKHQTDETKVVLH